MPCTEPCCCPSPARLAALAQWEAEREGRRERGADGVRELEEEVKKRRLVLATRLFSIGKELWADGGEDPSSANPGAAVREVVRQWGRWELDALARLPLRQLMDALLGLVRRPTTDQEPPVSQSASQGPHGPDGPSDSRGPTGVGLPDGQTNGRVQESKGASSQSQQGPPETASPSQPSPATSSASWPQSKEARGRSLTLPRSYVPPHRREASRWSAEAPERRWGSRGPWRPEELLPRPPDARPLKDTVLFTDLSAHHANSGELATLLSVYGRVGRLRLWRRVGVAEARLASAAEAELAVRSLHGLAMWGKGMGLQQTVWGSGAVAGSVGQPDEDRDFAQDSALVKPGRAPPSRPLAHLYVGALSAGTKEEDVRLGLRQRRAPQPQHIWLLPAEEGEWKRGESWRCTDATKTRPRALCHFGGAAEAAAALVALRGRRLGPRSERPLDVVFA